MKETIHIPRTLSRKFIASLLCATLIVSALFGFASAEAAVAPPPSYPLYDTANINNESAWNIMNTHDPEIIKDGSYYYTFSTDYKVGGTATPGIQVRRSTDLINWEWVGYALSGVPAAAKSWTGAVVGAIEDNRFPGAGDNVR